MEESRRLLDLESHLGIVGRIERFARPRPEGHSRLCRRKGSSRWPLRPCALFCISLSGIWVSWTMPVTLMRMAQA